jgi:hypothetical protein
MIDGSVQHARTGATSHVYVWMECVRMAKNTHQLRIYLRVLSRHRAPLPRGFAHLHSTEQHATGNYDSSHHRKHKGRSQLQRLWVGPFEHYIGK